MMNNTGILVQIIGAVVDADFSQAETLPALLNALEVDYEVDGRRKTLVLEVQQHIGDGWVRAVAMSSTDGLRRGMPVRDTGRPIEVPVGQCVLGTYFQCAGGSCGRARRTLLRRYEEHPPRRSAVGRTIHQHGSAGNGHQGN